MKARNLLALVTAALLLFTLTACGGSASGSNKTEAMAPAEMGWDEYASEMESPAAGEGSSAVSALPENRKLIRTVYLDAETEDLESLAAAIDEKLAALGGYAENREVYNGSAYASYRYRRCSLTLRIPAENLDAFLEHVEGVSNVVSSNESVEDVTLQYVDTESRVKALETEQNRLLELLALAENTSEILEIESRLTEVRYELESVASQLRALQNQVSYSTVYLSIDEVREFTPVEEETAWERIRGGFMDSLEGIWEGGSEFVIWVLANSPYLVLWGLILAGAWVLTRKTRAKNKARKAAKKAAREMPQPPAGQGE